MKAIIASPAEDTPRLMYADYVKEHDGKEGERLAEFICLQIKISKHGYKPRSRFNREVPRVYCSSCLALYAIPYGDLTQNISDECPACENGGIAWSSAKRAIPDEHVADFKRERVLLDTDTVTVDGFNPIWPTWLHRRGFPAGLCCSRFFFSKHAKTLFSAHPIEFVYAINLQIAWSEDAYDPEESHWFINFSDTNIDRQLCTKFPILLSEFEDHKLARELLSRGLVSIGRELAGLSPLYDQELDPIEEVRGVAAERNE
jgi:uncharacterized protein (TIGR02996 family)